MHRCEVLHEGSWTALSISAGGRPLVRAPAPQPPQAAKHSHAVQVGQTGRHLPPLISTIFVMGDSKVYCNPGIYRST